MQIDAFCFKRRKEDIDSRLKRFILFSRMEEFPNFILSDREIQLFVSFACH